MKLRGLVALACVPLFAGAVYAESAVQQHGTNNQSPGIDLGKQDANAPINVSSDTFVGDFEKKQGIYVGNVIVTQADYRLRADQVKVEIVNGQPNRFFADGKVVFDSPRGTATGDNGVYDLNPPRTLTLTGNVILTKEKDVMRGTNLVVNLDTGKSNLTARGAPGHRVISLFVPKQQETGKTSKTPQK